MWLVLWKEMFSDLSIPIKNEREKTLSAERNCSPSSLLFQEMSFLRSDRGMS
jgi:hypothetical protein